MGEYNQYTVTDLTDMTITDDEESMRSIATGWVNTGEVLGTAKDALKQRLEELRAVWTSPSFGVFEAFINRTVANIEAAETQADNRAGAASQIATTAGWAKERVFEQYTEYLQAKLSDNGDSLQTKVLKSFGGPAGPIMAGVGSLTNKPPTDDEIRAPYDKQARKIMKIALEDYEQSKSAMVQEVVPVVPIKAPDKEWSDGQDSWPGDGGSGSNASDMAGLSAVSYGGNAVGAHVEPSLQSMGHSPATPVAQGHIGGAPPSSGFSHTPVGGFPTNTMSAYKPPAGPPKLPVTPANQARNTLPLRGAHSATRTPGLPTRNGTPVRNNVPATGRSANRWAGRGLQKSQMAPVDRVGQPRKAGEVLGKRASAAKPVASGKATSRKVQSTVVRGGNKTGKLQSNKNSPVDNTKRGYTSRILNPRNRFADGHSRTPYVGARLNTNSKPEPFGKRPEPETRRKKIRREIDAAREARRKKLTQSKDGLSRPVISNGVNSPAQLNHAIPTPREAVEREEGLWQPPADLVRGVIGKREWDCDTFVHDPGPVVNARAAQVEALDERVSRLHEPGPTAFDASRKPVDPWPRP